MAVPKGTRIGGRQKGTPNKISGTIKYRLQQLGCDPIRFLAKVVNNDVQCGVCRGTGITAFQPQHGDEPGKRLCQSCWGSKLERLSPKERAWAAGELLQYCESKLKQVDHTSSDGSNRPIWVVNVAQEVKQPQAIDTKAHPRVLDVPKDDNVQ